LKINQLIEWPFNGMGRAIRCMHRIRPVQRNTSAVLNAILTVSSNDPGNASEADNWEDF
jgi:hypothetical protein